MNRVTTFRNSMLIVLLSMLAVPAFSQIKIGVKADVGLNNPTFSTEAFEVENLTTYSIGPSIEIMVPFEVADFGVEASLLYNDNRMTVYNLVNERKGDISNRYLILPVNAKVKLGLGGLPLKLFGTAGPYAGYLISDEKVDFDEIHNNIKAREFQAGANVGIGLEVLRMLQVGVNYSVKLTDNYALDEPKWSDPLNGKTQSWSVTAAIYF